MTKFSALLMFTLAIPDLLLAQNLVPNPSFECGFDDCDVTTEITIATFEHDVCNWNIPNLGTSDIFSDKVPATCWTSMPYSTYANPNNPVVGSQLPRTGHRFAGIIPYAGNVDEYTKNPYREYLQVELQSALVPGEYYCAEMFVSLAERPKYAVNNLGMHFHDEKIDRDFWKGNLLDGFPLILTPQVLESDVILDTIKWVRVSGVFQATTPAKFLIVGNFKEDRDMTLVNKIGHPSTFNYNSAYYFIDDVSVEKIQTKQFTIAGASAICEGEEIELNASGGLNDIVWSTLSDTLNTVATGPTLKVSPSTTTTYRVSGRNCNLIINDTVTIKVNPMPQINLGKDTTICTGSSLNLDAGIGYIQYTWQNNSSSRFFNVTKAGKYFAWVKDQYNCIGYDDISISLAPIPGVNLGDDILVCGDFPYLQAGGSKFSYEWSTGSTDSVFTPSAAGSYWVNATNQCGEARDSITVYSFGDIFIPNVLTLNGDGLNAKFQINGIGPSVIGKLKIYNRMGKEIFSSDNYNGDWPYEDDKVPTGVYYYILTYNNCASYKGSIQVLR